MNIRRNTKGFTLLELIVVIIIVGVLATIALPRFFNTVEFSRGSEALYSLTQTRGAMERRYLRDATYANANVFTNLDIADPSTNIGSQFTYGITIGAAATTDFTIVATRHTTNGGNGSHTVFLMQTTTAVTRGGSGAFSGI